MLSQSTRYKAFLLLKSISENEQIVEEQRQQLCKQHGFEPWAAFKRIDRQSRGKLSAHDIITFLRENMVDYMSEVECFHMFRFFDRDNDGLLDFEDFLQLCLPVLDPSLRAKASQRMNYEVCTDDRL
jgi:Ca2+-binding EF-hand superfamily protein